MRLITLNIWGGHIKQPLLDFIASHCSVEIFCFQEAYHKAPQKISDEERAVSLNILSEIHNLLPNHRLFFRPVVNNIYGIGMLVHRDVEVIEEGDLNIHHNPDYPGLGPAHSRNLQWLKCRSGDQVYSIMNVHGLWNGKGKTDAPERIAQSQRIKNFMNDLDTPKILCGDFNLRPDTESLKIIEQGMDNLIRRFNVTSTRTKFYPKEERFADYVFTSPEVTINHFEVLEDEVSDHSPLLVDFG